MKVRSIKSDLVYNIIEGRIYDVNFITRNSKPRLMFINNHWVKEDKFKELFIEVDPNYPYKYYKKTNIELTLILIAIFVFIIIIISFSCYFLFFRN